MGPSALLTLVSFSRTWTLTIRIANEHGFNARSAVLTTRHPALALFAQLADKSVLTVAPEAGLIIGEYARLLVVARIGATGAWAYRYLIAKNTADCSPAHTSEAVDGVQASSIVPTGIRIAVVDSLAEIPSVASWAGTDGFTPDIFARPTVKTGIGNAAVQLNLAKLSRETRRAHARPGFRIHTRTRATILTGIGFARVLFTK